MLRLLASLTQPPADTSWPWWVWALLALGVLVVLIVVGVIWSAAKDNDENY